MVTKEIELCPTCKVSWTALAEMLSEGVESDNYQYALKILGNCPECNMQFNGKEEAKE